MKRKLPYLQGIVIEEIQEDIGLDELTDVAGAHEPRDRAVLLAACAPYDPAPRRVLNIVAENPA
jgi:hypothetical protein